MGLRRWFHTITTSLPKSFLDKGDDMQSGIASILKEHEALVKESFLPPQCQVLEKVAHFLVEAFGNGKKVLLCGNGGSAADAQHIAAEFIVRFKKERKSLPTIALTTDTSILTATANDYHFDAVFKRQVEGLGQPGDVLIGISTSGNSSNVVEAIRVAKQMSLRTVAFTGAAGGKLAQEADVCFRVPSQATSHIQEIHIAALHAITEFVEETLFP